VGTDREDPEEQNLFDRLAPDAETLFRIMVEKGTAVVYLDHFEDPQDTIYVSPQFEEVFGWAPADLLANQDLWMDSIHPDDRERVDELDRLPEEGVFNAEYRIVNRSGEMLWLHEQGHLVYDTRGEPLYWLGVALDVTELKRTERALELEQAALERLEQLDRAKDALLDTVSHDFRSPLANILGFGITLQRMLPDLPEAEVIDYLERIVANAKRLERLVNDVLDLSRSREGFLRLHSEPTDLGALVKATVENLSLPPSCSLRVEADVVPIAVDVVKVERIVDNLVSNAVAHNAAGVNILVRVSAVAGGAEIVVQDDGQGVPDELHGRLYEPFAAAQEPRDASSPGLGLGLSIVSQMVELHGGRVWLEETPGGGATFHVFLPS
jgi:PAS domain S-box-containing protein